MKRFLLIAAAFLLPYGANAADTCTAAPSCASLGYSQTASQCSGSYVACPFDTSKVACFEGAPRVGDLKYSLYSSNHNGWLKCDGTQYSQTAYPKLADFLKTKFCHKYTSRTDTAYTTSNCKPGYFAVPDYRGFFLRGVNSNNSSSNTVGAPSPYYGYALHYKGDKDNVTDKNGTPTLTHSTPYVPVYEQLPNIIGTGPQLDDQLAIFTIDGAFYKQSTTGAYDAKSSLSGNKSRMMFDASRYNAIYGGKHVVPASYGVYIYIYAGE